MAGHQGAISDASKQPPWRQPQHAGRCVCVQVVVFSPLSSSSSSSSPSFLSASSENPFSRGMLLTQRLLAAFPLPSACWTKLNPVVNTVGKENDTNLWKSVIKRQLGDFSCFHRNVGLSL